MKELLRLECLANDNDNISFHKDKKTPDEVEIRIYNSFEEREYAVVLDKSKIKEVVNTLLEIL